MDRSGLQRLIPIVLVLIIVAVAVAALVSLGRMLFSGDSQEQAPQINAGKEELTSTMADHSVRMTVRGPIVADENFHSYAITASPDTRTMITYRGYLGDQVDASRLENNTKAYQEFVYALDRLGMMDGMPLEDEANDTRGICATGLLYEFEVRQGTNTVEKLWTTTCKGALGSLEASVSQVSRLFQQQIPDFSKLATKVRLNR